MRKVTKVILFGLLLATLLTACAHEHSWQTATCTTPAICAKCGEIAGSAQGHRWQEATCEAPRSCIECGTTEGAALGHIYGAWGSQTQDAQGQWFHSRYCEICGAEQTELTQAPEGRTDLGSAGSPEGTTLLISIFANELTTQWDFQSEQDQQTRSMMHYHLSEGVKWLSAQIGAYGVEADFIYDWEACPDLYYTYDFGELVLVRPDGGGYWKQENYVLEHIPTQALKEKYNAQNVIYMFYFNTDESNTVNSWSLSDRQDVQTEIINVFVRDDLADEYYYMPASSFAHEIMHCFGAYDLYYASEAISQDYVDHCRETDSQDIMYTVCLGDTIPQEFTELDAYYMGLVDSCEEVENWNLGESTF